MPENGTKRDRFGRYLILDHLVDGGMAKICRARFLGEQADKIVAIKMVQSQYSKDESFKTMFMDEIKLTFPLIHPNIIQTYDYGLHEKQLFVAMEYCDGRNLKEYLDKLKERKFVFPVEISVYIITQVCQGLHYAHTYTDKLTGISANIIHRDISPHNIMLTYDGAIKVIDFGIAKADSNSEQTQVGTIKGKLSYLAPEYLEGEELNSTYDEFAVGITLWEMLCSRKLFKATNDLAVLKKIQECKIPAPSSINPNVPKELDEIVLKALKKDRNKRYIDLDKLNRALMKFLYANYPDFNATDLSYFAKELFKEEIKIDREKMFEFGKIDLSPYLEDLRHELRGGDENESTPPRDTRSSSSESKKKEARVIDFGFEDKQKTTKKKKRSKKKVDLDERYPHLGGDPEKGKKEILLEGQTSEPSLTKKKISKTSPHGKVKPKVTIMTGVKAKTSQRTSTRTNKIKIPVKKKVNITRIAMIAALVIGAGYVFLMDNPTREIACDKDKNGNCIQEILVKVTPSPYATASQEAQYGSIQLMGFDKYWQKVFINGMRANVGVLGDLSVKAGKKVIIRIQQHGRKHYIRRVTLEPDQTIKIQVPDMPSASYGYLITSRPCVTGKLYFSLFNEKRIESLPIPKGAGIPFPAKLDAKGYLIPVTYKVYYESKDGIKRKVKFKVENEDESIDLCEKI
ncbi:MAG: serine/threonine protein kinase [Bacteriovoracaceae bacterium]|jgi:eukaryotic-like serine/threonine-protein kinase|nr:serine/threonine protein kinase [Bacteriovoracaceae bacterium]